MEKDLSPDLLVFLRRLSLVTGMPFSVRKRSLLHQTYNTQTHRRNRKRKGNPMSNNGKNAYEIRLEVLQLAANQADSAYYNQIELARLAAGEGKVYELPEDKRTREALKIAKKLYAFVEGEGEGEESE